MAMFDQRYQNVTTQYNTEHITTIHGISAERHERLAEELGVTRSALTSFFNILEQQQVPPEDLDHTLRQIATSYKDLQTKLHSFSSDDPAIVALKQQAHTALETGEFARAEALLNEAAAKDIEAATHLQETAATRLVSAAASVANLGELKMTQLAYADAVGYFQQAAELIEALPTAPQDTLARYLAAWGRAAYEAGAYGAAERPYQRALAIREEALGLMHPDVASSLNNLAELYRMQGQYTQAEPLYQRALAICQDPSAPQDALVLPTILNNLAVFFESQGRHAEAEPLYQQALTVWEQTPERSSRHIAVTLDNLAELRRAQGRYAEAELLYARSLAIFTQQLTPTHPDVATGLNNLAQLYQAQGRDAEAESLYRQALDIREAVLGRTHPDVAHSLNNLAQLYTNRGQYAQAEPLHWRALRIRQETLAPTHPEIAQSLNNLALFYWGQGRYAEAEPLYQQAITICEATLGPAGFHLALVLENYAILLRAMGRTPEAEELATRAGRIRAHYR